MLGERLYAGGSLVYCGQYRLGDPRNKREKWFLFILIALLISWIMNSYAHAGVKIPGSDASDKLEAAGTVLRIVDSMLFSWGARIFAGLAVMSAGWNLKEQRFGIAVLCVVAAIILGTAPMWVKNIFDIGGGGSVFSLLSVPLGGSDV